MSSGRHLFPNEQEIDSNLLSPEVVDSGSSIRLESLESLSGTQSMESTQFIYNENLNPEIGDGEDTEHTGTTAIRSHESNSAHFMDGYDDYLTVGGDIGNREPEVELGFPSIEPSKQHRFSTFLKLLWNGPKDPINMTEYQPLMLFEKVQLFPVKLYENSRYNRILTISTFVVVSIWIFIFLRLTKTITFAEPKAYNQQTEEYENILLLSCGANELIWKGSNEACGLNAESCKPFENKTLNFRCPARCWRESWTFTEKTVGNQEVMYRSYVIGGANIISETASKIEGVYRGDSYVCGAGLHSGIISTYFGGCGRIQYNGAYDSFKESEGKGGISSIGFDSYFPFSYIFANTDQIKFSNCYDYRNFIIWVQIITSVVFSYFTVNAGIFYWVLTIMGFWTIILCSDPPITSLGSLEMNAELVSLGFKRFLPASFVLYVIWRFISRPQLYNNKASLTKTVFWLGPFWVGILNNYTLDNAPIDRLTVKDIKAQAGSWIALLTLILVLSAGIILQATIIWKAGKFKKYLSFYILVIIMITIFANIIDSEFPMSLRIHHYIAGLILLPGTAFRTTPGFVFQGLLLGLYISGSARWGMDSIFETISSLQRGGPSGNGIVPSIVGYEDNQIKWKSNPEHNITSVEHSTVWNTIHGYSLLINDFEVYRGADTNFSLNNWANNMGLNDENRFYARVAYVYDFEKISDYSDVLTVSL